MRGVFSERTMEEFVKVMWRLGCTKTFIESHGLVFTTDLKPFSVEQDTLGES